MQKAVPYAAELKQAIEQAQPRPVSPGLHADLAGDLREREQGARRASSSPEDALAQGNEQIDEALATF